MNGRIKHLVKILEEPPKVFARNLGFKPKYVKKIIQGKRKPTLELVRLIVLYYQVNANWLLTGKGPLFIDRNSSKHSKIYQHNTGKSCLNIVNVYASENVLLEDTDKNKNNE